MMNLSDFKFNNYFKEFFYAGLLFVLFIINKFVHKGLEITFLDELKKKVDKYKNAVNYFNFGKGSKFTGVVKKMSEKYFEPDKKSSKDREKEIRNWNRKYIKEHPGLVDKNGRLIGSDLVVAMPEEIIQEQEKRMIKAGVRADIIEKKIKALQDYKRRLEELE